MTARLLRAALGATLAVVVAACGDEREQVSGRTTEERSVSGDGVPGSVAPTPTRTRTSSPSPRPRPTWPDDCERVRYAIDHRSAPAGHSTQQEAAAAEGPKSLVVLAVPAGSDRFGQWWLVDSGTNQIRAEVSVTKAVRGWTADGVERCR